MARQRVAFTNATHACRLAGHPSALYLSCITMPHASSVQGKKLDGSMLGFASGTNYALLEQPE